LSNLDDKQTMNTNEPRSSKSKEPITPATENPLEEEEYQEEYQDEREIPTPQDKKKHDVSMAENQMDPQPYCEDDDYNPKGPKDCNTKDKCPDAIHPTDKSTRPIDYERDEL